MSGSVLVVDDDADFRELAGRLLAASGLVVIGEADSVAAARTAAVQLKPSAVTTAGEARLAGRTRVRGQGRSARRPARATARRRSEVGGSPPLESGFVAR